MIKNFETNLSNHSNKNQYFNYGVPKRKKEKEIIGEFIGKEDNINQANEQIDILLNDTGKFNSDKTFKLYNTLFDNIKELESNNINNNGLSFNNFNRSGNTSNNNFISSGKDNNFLGQYSGIKNNFIRGKNPNMIGVDN